MIKLTVEKARKFESEAEFYGAYSGYSQGAAENCTSGIL
jgi:hypothetical protein